MGKYHHGDYDVYLRQLEAAKEEAKSALVDGSKNDMDPFAWKIRTLAALRTVILPALQGAWSIAHENK